LKIKLELGQKVALTSEISKDSEGDIQASLSVFEEILETKFEDECEVLSNLDKELKQLQTASSENPELSKELSNFAATLFVITDERFFFSLVSFCNSLHSYANGRHFLSEYI
jgi:3-methyladenine DNA glycosylase/8-oxoguanine DNA glycosylase